MDTVSFQQVVTVLMAKMENQRSQKFATFFAAADDYPLREAGTKQLHQFLRASMTVESYAAGDVRVVRCLFTLFRQKDLFPFFLSESTLLQTALTRKKAAAKTNRP